ncbi:hypothetical protein LTSEADE_0976 [Salmonella enterica subsp. enterica serovar Adelaide str. A4-669]|uniref:Uncharacterized protein n=1 Tax=Salmonella enterica subsp. enterica serovar Adelaide str. A4-669 TaxID=913063 RepID=A0A6C8GRM8_SALET|nr:hypothetical protein LTSEADE_0976 [Salmonella enterica subsp. enterica serovar Adelaide str. A4-669]
MKKAGRARASGLGWGLTGRASGLGWGLNFRQCGFKRQT